MNTLDKALLVLLIIITLIFVYFLYSLSHQGLQCVVDPLGFYEKATSLNDTCFCTSNIPEYASSAK